MIADGSTPFVVLATYRTGSTWVVGMLDSHPAVGTYSELFEQRGKGFPGWGRSDVPYLAAYLRERSVTRNHLARARGCFSYLDELYSEKEGLDAIGFKLMYVHVKQNPAALAYLRARRVRVIHLVRRNLLDVLVSDDAGRARKQFHSLGVDLAPVTVAVDASRLVARLTTLDRQVRLARLTLALIRVPAIEVAYEELVDDHGRFDDLLAFIGVDGRRHELTTDLRKLNRLPRREIIENYDEIERALSGTRFSRCLD